MNIKRIRHTALMLLSAYVFLLSQITFPHESCNFEDNGNYPPHIESSQCECLHHHSAEEESLPTHHHHHHCTFCCGHLDFLKHNTIKQNDISQLTLVAILNFKMKELLPDDTEIKSEFIKDYRTFSPLETYLDLKSLRAPPQYIA